MDLAQYVGKRREARGKVATSLHSLEALKPWNIHALAKRQLQWDLKYIYKAGPCSPLRAVGREGIFHEGEERSHLQRHVCPAPLELRVLLSGHAMLQLSPPWAAGSEKVKHPVILCCLIEETQKGEKKEEMFRGLG